MKIKLIYLRKHMYYFHNLHYPALTMVQELLQDKN